MNENGTAKISGLSFSDGIIPTGRSLFYFDSASGGQLTLSNLSFQNTKLRDGISLFMFGSFASINAQNVNFNSITPVDNSDTTTLLVSLSAISSNVNSNITLTDIVMDSCAVAFMTVSNTQQSYDIDTHLTLTNVSISNGHYAYTENVIEFNSIKSNGVFQITLDQFTFSDITFERGGNLILFGHQQSDALVFKNSTFHKVVNGGINIESFDKQAAENLSKIKMTDIIVADIEAQDTRFILVQEGGYLEVYSSQFMHVSNTLTGAVIYGGYQKTTTLIYDSLFTNNTSIDGAVFNIESESVIKCTNCTFQYNFAIGSGVIKANDDGYYEFYN